jgi:hypothetical protein
MLRKWSEPVVGAPEPTDIEWPLGSGRYLRPGPEAEALLLGRWPRQAVNSVWGEAIWARCLQPLGVDGPLEIGLDVARFGDDATVAVVRKGPSAVDLQRRAKLATTATAQFAAELAGRWGVRYQVEPRKVLIKTDDAGVGGGVTDQLRANGYRCVPCLGVNRALHQRLYPNRRSENWFLAAELAAAGKLSVSRLPAAARVELRNQLLGARYEINSHGQRVVEEKKASKERLRKSPDEADAFLLAFGPEGNVAKVITIGGG